MVRHVTLGELAISTAGVALRRSMFTGSDQDAKAAIELIARAMVGLSNRPWSYGYELVEADASSGYGAIAGAYDRAGGPDVDAEQPAMWKLFDRLSAGTAVDVACGTGRHLARLTELGHQVIGVDQSPEISRWRGSECQRRGFSWAPWEGCQFGRRAAISRCALSRSSTRRIRSPLWRSWHA